MYFCKQIIYLLSIVFLFVILSCSNDDDYIPDPKNDIIGKWEMVKRGSSMDNLMPVESTWYYEFINDSVYIEYDRQTDQGENGDYSLNDEYLTFYFYVHGGDIIPMECYYDFEDKNTLILNLDGFALYNFSVFKRR